ncbi:MAG: hypothetical protein ABIV13_05960, partial [Fimbriimonadales bacterium]
VALADLAHYFGVEPRRQELSCERRAVLPALCREASGGIGIAWERGNCFGWGIQVFEMPADALTRPEFGG